MIIKFVLGAASSTITIQRDEKGESKVRGSGWSKGMEHGWEAEHSLLFKLKKILNEAGFDLIKKRMSKDGHMVGQDATPYLRAKGHKKDSPHICIYDGNSELRNSAEEYNDGKEVTFMIEDAWEADQDDRNIIIANLCRVAGIECEGL